MRTKRTKHAKMRIKSVMHLWTTFQPSQDQNKCILMSQSFPKRFHLIWNWNSKSELLVNICTKSQLCHLEAIWL